MKKIILTLAGFCFLFSDVFGQPVIEWQNTIGGNYNDQLFSIKQTVDGGYILGGSSQSSISGDKTENSYGLYDYWIVKTDLGGNIQWQNNIGGNFNDMLNSIEYTNDGGYILGGWSLSTISGDKTETSNNEDYWIVKTDSLGNIQWQNTIWGNLNDELYSIQQTTDGGYILGGWSDSDSSGDKTENSSGADYWIVKTDSTGNIQWQNTIGGDGHDRLRSIQQTSDGGYILGGYSDSDSSGDKTENNIDYSIDFWIVKTDSIGNIQWQKTIGGNDGDYLYSVEQTNDGGYILGGTYRPPVGPLDYWVVKVDTIGNIAWQKKFGGGDTDGLYSLQQTNDGGYIIGGESRSNSNAVGFKSENCLGDWDYWVLKLDASGNIQWDKTIGGTEYDELHTIRQTDDGGYILGGYSFSNTSAYKGENSNGMDDYWIVKITDKFNSITGKLFFDFNNNQIQDFGELPVKNKMITEFNSGRFNFSDQSGNYLVSVLDSGNFSVSPASVNYYNPVPSSHNAYFSGMHQTDSLKDFAFQAITLFNDLCLTITPMGNFRAGMNANYMINYENVGTTTLNATVIFFPDNDVTFVSSNPVATSVTTDSVVWNVGTLTPFQTGSILVTVNVNIGTAIGTLINSNVRIEPVAGDNYPGCNYAYWEIYTTGAVDPNAILVNRDTVLTTELSSPPYLNYTIYFQNTGNDTAFNARVLNNIPQTLDVNSFEFVASSHPMNITYGAHARLMEFTFDNILLPDSNINEPASHGFIRYKIKPVSTLVVGDSIKNNAAIYFDFNQPVLTDTAVTEIVLPTGAEEFDVQSLKFKVFPNPVRDELIVNSYSLSGEKAEIKIYDLFGRKVYQRQPQTLNFNLQTKINVSRFSQGVYFIEMRSGEKALRAKFVKQ